MPQALNPTGPSSAAIQRRGTVQKHRQSTQRLSIQIEGGCRLTGRCRRACDSSFLWTCHWGGCSESIRSEVMSAANACTVVAGHLLTPFWTKETGGVKPILSPSLVSVGKGIDTAGGRHSQGAASTWPQLPIEAPDCWLCPTQIVALQRQEFW